MKKISFLMVLCGAELFVCSEHNFTGNMAEQAEENEKG